MYPLSSVPMAWAAAAASLACPLEHVHDEPTTGGSPDNRRRLVSWSASAVKRAWGPTGRLAAHRSVMTAVYRLQSLMLGLDQCARG